MFKIKNFKMRKSSWIIWWGPKCNSMYHFKRKEEGNLIAHRGKENMKMEQREFKDNGLKDTGGAA